MQKITNKMVYGEGMLNNVRNHNLMPEEIFSKQNRMADDGTLCKTLFYRSTRSGSNSISQHFKLLSQDSTRDGVISISGIWSTNNSNQNDAKGNQKYEVFLENRIRRLNIFCWRRYQHKDAGIVSGEWGITSRLGSYKHLHPSSP
jgi:hypothetical protein